MFKRRNAQDRAGHAGRRAGARQACCAAGDGRTRAMDAQRLDALAYPTLRRKAGDHRRAAGRRRNCQLSPSTGLPAIAMPAGFTDDGVPVGIELLGPAWSEPKLLAMAYRLRTGDASAQAAAVDARAREQQARQSALTFIVNLAGAHVTFSFDPVAGSLAWDATSIRPLVASDAPRASGARASHADDQQGERGGRDR